MMMGETFEPAQSAPRPAELRPKPKWTSTGPPWTILCVAPHMERKVAETLREAGLTVHVPVETYLPKTANVAKAYRPWKPRTRPLIPGYVFAELPDEAALDLARANANVRLWCREGLPITVPALVVGTLVWFEGGGLFDRTRKTSGARNGRRRGKRGAPGFESRWKSGQRVKIGDGPFAGFIGTIMRADRDDRIEVLVSIFGRETPVQLDERDIEEEGE